MLVFPLRYYGHNVRHGVFAIGNSNVYQIVSGINKRNYSSKDSKCVGCKDTPQAEGRRVEPWPKSDPAPPIPWRCECPRDPQPVNNDPYRIRVPEILVPPLPKSSAKDGAEDCKVVFRNTMSWSQPTAAVATEAWRGRARHLEAARAALPRLSYHGHNKYKFAFHEPWKPLDRLALLERAEKEELDHSDDIALSAPNSDREL